MPAGGRRGNAQSYGRWMPGGEGEKREKRRAGRSHRQGTGRRVPAHTPQCSGGEVLTGAAATRPTPHPHPREGDRNSGGRGDGSGGRPTQSARRGGAVCVDSPLGRTPRRRGGARLSPRAWRRAPSTCPCCKARTCPARAWEGDASQHRSARARLPHTPQPRV